MAVSPIPREPGVDQLPIPAVAWSSATLLDEATPCIDKDVTSDLQYVTGPADTQAQTSFQFQARQVQLHGFTWSESSSQPNLKIRVTFGASIVINTDSKGNDGPPETCRRFTASVTGLEPTWIRNFTLEITPGDASVRELVIIQGFLEGGQILPRVQTVTSLDHTTTLSVPAISPVPPDQTKTSATTSAPSSTSISGPVPSDGASPPNGNPSASQTSLVTAPGMMSPPSAPTEGQYARRILQIGIPLCVICPLLVFLVLFFRKSERVRRRDARPGPMPVTPYMKGAPHRTGTGALPSVWSSRTRSRRSQGTQESYVRLASPT